MFFASPGEYLLAALLSLQAGLLPAQPQSLEPPTRARGYNLEQSTVSEEELRKRFSSNQLELLEKLNRSDVDHPVLILGQYDFDEPPP